MARGVVSLLFVLGDVGDENTNFSLWNELKGTGQWTLHPQHRLKS